MNNFVNLRSEIGKLNTVMLHRPGIEVNQLIPDYHPYGSACSSGIACEIVSECFGRHTYRSHHAAAVRAPY